MNRTLLVASVLVLFVAATAHADPTKDECVDANTRGQVARTAGKFREARAAFELCSAPSCPAMIRSDCTERLDDVTRNAPTVVFDVKDAAGVDLVETTVTIDGAPFLQRLDGHSVAVDSGEHTFVFTSRGHLPSTQHVLVHDGDKERRVSVVMGAPALEQPTQPVEAPPPVEQKPPPDEPASPGRAQRTIGIVLGATGLVTLGVSALLTGLSVSAWNQSQAECSDTSCTQHDQAVMDHDNAYALAVGATVTVIAGGVLAATGLLVVLSAPHAKKNADARLRLTPLVGSTTGLVIGGTF